MILRNRYNTGRIRVKDDYSTIKSYPHLRAGTTCGKTSGAVIKEVLEECVFILTFDSGNDVLRAQTDERYLNRFIEKNRKFILSSASRCVNRYVSDSDDEWSVALIAFHEAVRAYDTQKGDFHAFAGIVIRRRLLDYIRSESRHANEISVEPALMSGDMQSEDGVNQMQAQLRRRETELSMQEAGLRGDPALCSVKDEIEALQQQLAQYGFGFFDLAQCSPKTEKTRRACAQAVQVLLKNTLLFQGMRRSRALPVSEIMKETAIQRKILDRHRRYIIAAAEILNGQYPQLAVYMSYIRKASQT